ncbi:hypothetical protein ACIQ6R_04100 [Streptomyces sp. NPDC096048]|uniref:hypothetical protein n=1 Tax=Streptomyces sp. NPDC096048 TaxID=3366072 RepID=UPI00381D0DD5
MSSPNLRVAHVFVAGGLPTITYNPRSTRNLEEELRDYLDEGFKILSVSGPTKTGKTVLVRNVIPESDAFWLSGGSITSINDFWETLADKLDLFTDVEHSTDVKDEEWRTRQGGFGLGGLKGMFERKEIVGDTKGSKFTRSRHVSNQVREAINGLLEPIVIDDFHYIPQEVQLEIVRAIKDLVFNGLRVIVIAVPHRAYDVVRVEKEMTGRVQQVEVGFWSEEELLGIARQGFAALDFKDKGFELSDRLARESFASPHLMQDFCLQLCKKNGFRDKQDHPVELAAPEWNEFFSQRSSMTSKTAFDLLARGPRQRTDRQARKLKSGLEKDIYGVILEAISHTGPKVALTYEEIRAAIREILASDIPQRGQVIRVLEAMSKIAKKDLEGEPVVDFDKELATLYISDPYFAFFLRWGSR